MLASYPSLSGYEASVMCISQETEWPISSETYMYTSSFSQSRYIFSDLLIEEIPKLRKSIEDQSRAELTVRGFPLPRPL